MQPTDASALLARKERYYKRNYLTLMLEGFLFTFSCTMFSYTTVLPVYVSKLTSNAFFVSLISVMYYGFGYGASIFSTVIGVNAKSPKWISIWVCGLQRIGFILIFLSTYTSGNAALALFFISFSVYSVSAGMSLPMFNQMVATSIHRNTGGFYGSYYLIGNAAGVLASTLMTRIFSLRAYPVDYRLIFLIGTLTAVVASFVVGFGIKEVTDDRVVENIRFSEVFSLLRDIFRTNKLFSRFVVVRALAAAAEFSVPYFIIKAGAFDDVPAGFVGTMTTVLLISNMFASKLMGWLGDKRGPLFMVAAACASGVAATLLALFMPGYSWSYLMFLFVALASQGLYLSSNLAAIEYSGRVRTPLYSAAAGLASSPVYIAASLLGAAAVNRFSLDGVFVIALAAFAVCFVLSAVFMKKTPAEQSQE